MKSRIDGKQNPEYYKEYYRRNRKRIAEREKKRYEKLRSTPSGLKKHRERCNEATKRYRKRHPDRIRKQNIETRLKRKRRAMELIGEVKCRNCGCDEIDFLEFNHIGGGGCKEYRKNGHGMVHQLLTENRGTDGLEILCRVCNALDYLERKNKESAKKYKVQWR